MRAFVVFMKSVHDIIPWISKICLFLSSIAIVVLLVIFGWLVYGRYVVNVTPTWVEQLALVLVCYITFLGAATGIHEETHLGVSFIREMLPDPIRKSLRILVDLILATFGAIMLVSCLELVQFGWDIYLPMLGIPEGIRTLSAMLFGGFCFLFAGSHAISKIYLYYFADQTAQEQEKVN